VTTSNSPTVEGPRGCRPVEYGETLDLLNWVFRAHQGHRPSMGGDYPHLYNLPNVSNLRILKVDGRIVSCVAIYQAQVRCNSAEITVGGIGGVGTDPDHRGKGYARLCLTDALSHMAAQNCDLSILWTGIDDFYRALGWERAGLWAHFQIDNSTNSLLPIIDPAKVSAAIDEQAIMDVDSLHTTSGQGLVRDLGLTELMLSRVGHHCYTLRDQLGGAASAYVVTNEGGTIKDYAGTPEGVLGLMKYAMTEHRWSHARIITPATADDTHKLLGDLRIPCRNDYLGMIHVLSPASLLSKTGLSDIAIKESGGEFTFTRHSESTVVSQLGLAKLLFGPERYSDFASDELPLDLYWSEWDHM